MKIYILMKVWNNGFPITSWFFIGYCYYYSCISYTNNGEEMEGWWRKCRGSWALWAGLPRWLFWRGIQLLVNHIRAETIEWFTDSCRWNMEREWSPKSEIYVATCLWTVRWRAKEETPFSTVRAGIRSREEVCGCKERGWERSLEWERYMRLEKWEHKSQLIEN